MLSSLRYLWDLYDFQDDSGFSEPISWEYFEMANAIVNWPTGTTNHGNNEPWNSSVTSLDDLHGRAASDYKSIIDTTAVDSTVVYDNNCGPGDD